MEASCVPFALIPLARPEMTPLAVPAVPLPPGTVLMPFIVDDAFYDDPDVCSLPDCSVAFLMLAGPWSARNSRSGFVPSSMLARFSSDPDLVTKTLHAAGLIWLVDGGVQITEGRGVTVVNAADVALKAEQADAAAEAERSAKSAGGQHGNHKRWHKKRGIRVPGCEFCEAPGTEMATSAKRTSHSDRMRLGSDSDATPIDRSDFDQNQSPGVSQVSQSRVSDARPREDPAVIAAVIDAADAKVHRAISPVEAESVIAKIRARPKTPKKIHDPVKYFTAAIENEADLYAELLGDPPPPLQVILSESATGHPAAERHPYDPDPFDPNPKTAACTCGLPRLNRRHEEARSA